MRVSKFLLFYFLLTSFFLPIFSRFFADDQVLMKHKKSKQHKQRVKELKEPAYTHKESEQAAGMGSYTMNSNKPEKTRMEIG